LRLLIVLLVASGIATRLEATIVMVGVTVELRWAGYNVGLFVGDFAGNMVGGLKSPLMQAPLTCPP
jgi:hypothetical protein